MTRVEAVRKRLRRSTRLELLEQRLAKSEARIKRQGARLTSLDERLRRQRALLDEVRPAAHRSRALYEILGAQVGSIEERLQALTEKVELGRFDATDDERAQARSLIEEIRDEHRRIRVRFGVVARYEERYAGSSRRSPRRWRPPPARAEAALHGALADAPTEGAVDLPDS